MPRHCASAPYRARSTARLAADARMYDRWTSTPVTAAQAISMRTDTARVTRAGSGRNSFI
jgi:hypothetical protein